MKSNMTIENPGFYLWLLTTYHHYYQQQRPWAQKRLLAAVECTAVRTGWCATLKFRSLGDECLDEKEKLYFGNKSVACRKVARQWQQCLGCCAAGNTGWLPPLKFGGHVFRYIWITYRKGPRGSDTDDYQLIKHRWCSPLTTKIYIYILFRTQENSRAFCIYKIRVVPLSIKVVGEVNSLFKVENLIKRWREKLWFWEAENGILNINIDLHNSAQGTYRIHVTVCRLTAVIW